MSGIFDLVSRLGKTIVINAIDEFFESLNTAKPNQPNQKNSPLFQFSNISEIDSPEFWDDLENRLAPRVVQKVTPKKSKVIRPTLKQTEQSPVSEEPQEIIMTDEEVNEELRAIKERLKKKSA